MVAGEVNGRILLYQDLFDDFLKTRPRQGSKWRPPNPPPEPQSAGEGRGGDELAS